MKQVIFIFTFILTLNLIPASCNSYAYAYEDNYLDQELFHAVSLGDIKKTRHLLYEGANPDISNDETGFSVLMAASRFSDTTLLKLLLDYGADVNHRMVTGESALYYAVQNNLYKSTLLLLDKGADPYIMTTKGFSLQYLARNNNNHQLTALLQAAQNNINIVNYPEVYTDTSLVLLNEFKLERAQEEALERERSQKLEKLMLYRIGATREEQFADTFFGKRPAPTVSLITPYSLARYQFGKADKSKKSVNPKILNEIFKYYQLAWIYVQPHKKMPFVEQVTVKIGEVVYPSLSRELHNPQGLFAASDLNPRYIWAFPLDLFSQSNELIEVIIHFPDGQYSAKIKAEAFAKVPLK